MMEKKKLMKIVYGFNRKEIPQLLKIDSAKKIELNMKDMVGISRSSSEYAIWRELARTHENATIDAISKLDTSELTYTKLHLHHYPLPLETILYKVGVYLLDKGNTSKYDIVELAMKEHILGNIGYVPLLISDHQHYHDGILEIEEDMIQGNGHIFEKKYIK